MTKTNKKGTSLVELLAVIVIMGIIAAIAVPTVGALLKNTRKKAAGSDVLTVVQSIDTFLAGADSADKKNAGITSTTFTLEFGTTDATKKGHITAIFDTETETVDRLEGTVTFTLNAAGNKIQAINFGDTTYTKDEKVYSGLTFVDGQVKVKEEAAA